jgi:hypothetical protein
MEPVCAVYPVFTGHISCILGNGLKADDPILKSAGTLPDSHQIPLKTTRDAQGFNPTNPRQKNVRFPTDFQLFDSTGWSTMRNTRKPEPQNTL